MSMGSVKEMVVSALSAVEAARSEVLAYREGDLGGRFGHETKLALNRLNVARYEMQRACEALGIQLGDSA